MNTTYIQRGQPYTILVTDYGYEIKALKAKIKEARSDLGFPPNNSSTSEI